MRGSQLRVSDDTSPGAWIAPRLRGEFGAVTLTVPSGYEAYVRICHPATDENQRRASWSDVAEATGRTAHPLMQWHALVGSGDPFNFAGSRWRGSPPERGNLAPDLLGVLCGLLADHTADAQHCYFGLWEGWAWIHGVGAQRLVYGGSRVDPHPEPPVIEPVFSPGELSRPRMRLPGRDYFLLTGPLSAVTQIGWYPFGPGPFSTQSPNLFWPADRTWCVASEIDFDSTLLGGTHQLVDAVLQASALDSWVIGPDDSLAADADRVNEVP